jgi:hypothetical protein
MLVQGIKSRPVYEGFAIDPHAKRHIFALEGEGALALLEQHPDQAAMSRSEILYTAGASRPKEHFATLSALGADQCWLAPSVDTLIFRLRGSLTNATMGTRLYTSGTEGFMGRVIQLGIDFGIDFRSIITDDVTASPFTCSHCGLTLLVRDHYSRRLAAFQGVNIDAEEPGTAPEPEELFP